MTRPVLVLRPEPGAAATAARARAIGLEPIVAPLFRIANRDWSLPDRKFDALLVTSANAARAIDGRLSRDLPVYAVGEATAAALRQAGFDRIATGDAGVAEIVTRAASDGVESMLHLAGEDRTAFDAGNLRITTRIVYTAEVVEPGSAFLDALDRGAVALLHSVRAARRFRELAPLASTIAALSPAVLAAAGPGWAASAVADRPDDDALLAAAARLCQ